MSEQRIAELRELAGLDCERSNVEPCLARDGSGEFNALAAHEWCDSCRMTFLVSYIDALSASPAETVLSVTGLDVIQRVVELMRNQTARFSGGSIVVFASTVDGWADEIEKALAETGRASETSGWRPIDSAPKNETVDFWIVPKLPEECYTDTSGNPITATNIEPYRRTCKFNGWGALYKAVAWMPLPAPPPSASSATTEQT